MMELYTTLLYQPIFNLLVWLYNVVPGSDIGVAIILLTIIVRLIFYPLSKKSIESQKALQDLQPKIEEIKSKYKDEREIMAQKMMALYKEEKINPASSCLPLLIQLPFLIAVYQVFSSGLTNGSFDLLYPFIAHPGELNPIAFGFLDLGARQWTLAVLAAAAQFWQAKMLQTKRPEVKGEGSRDEALASIMNKQMVYVMPLFTLYIGMRFPGGLTLYWLITTLWTVFQQKVIFKQQKEKEKAKNVGKNEVIDVPSKK